MKIAHISDVHIRNLKYHDEYRRVFENLYRKLEELKPDIIVNTGDTAHTKTQISPEYVEMASEHIKRTIEIAPYHIILGNHDLNLMNKERQDALSPIVESINSPLVMLHKKSGRVSLGNGMSFWVFSLADQQNYPLPSQWAQHPDEINIGLFHGSVLTCVTDTNWRMTHVEHDLSIFDGLDYVLMGDIHKQQFFKDGTAGYAGSLIQQNFGEELEKGFLLWEIDDKKNFRVNSHFLQGSRKFHTLKLNEDLSIPNVVIEEGSRIRIAPPRPITLVEQKEIEKSVKKRSKPYDVITLSSNNIGTQHAMAGKKLIDIENLRQVEVQERLIREFLAGKKLRDSIMTKVLDLNRRYQIHVDQSEDGARNVSWRINKLLWSNLFNYGEGNVIDFSRLGGLTGMFAPNGSGKSNFIDIILETCFDSTTKGINKNIFLINDNKEAAVAIADVSANDQSYLIERNIEKIRYGQRSLDKVKEWGKTTISFSTNDDNGGSTPLEGQSRPETERSIRQRVGTFDDFMLTSLSAQWNPMDIIAVKETRRKEIIYKFLDLDIFGQKCLLAREESKDHVRKLSELEDNGFEEAAKKYDSAINVSRATIREQKAALESIEKEMKEMDDLLVDLTGQRVKIDLTAKGLGDWAGRVKTLELSITGSKQKLGDLFVRLEALEEELSKVLKLEQRFDLKTFEGKESRYTELEDLIEIVAAKARTYTTKLAESEKNARLLNEVPCGDQFPTCKFLVNAFESKSRSSSLSDELGRLAEKRTAMEQERDGLLPFREKLVAYRKFVGEKESLTSRRDNLKLQVENVRLKLLGLESEKEKILEEKARWEQAETDLQKNNEIDLQIQKIRSRKLDKQAEARHIQDIVVEETRLMGSDQGVLEKLTTQLATLQDLRDTCSAYEHYTEAMGKDGIAYQILTQKLPLINEEINKILLNAADFGVFIEHDQEEQSIRFYLQYGQYKSRLLELGSGAEKFLASIAIRSALLNISNLPKTNMFIIDEGFGKLDPRNLESVQRMFDYLKTVFDHVIVISHLDTMKDIADNIIDITTDEEGYAHIEIGG